MTIHKKVYAHACAVTVGFLWVVCTAGIALLPDFSLTMSSWFMHRMDITTMGIWRVTSEGFIFGGLVLTAVGWVSGYVFGWSLEYFGKKA